MSFENGYMTHEELEAEAGRKMIIVKVNEPMPVDKLTRIYNYMEGATAFCMLLGEMWLSQSASPTHESAVWERLDS